MADQRGLPGFPDRLHLSADLEQWLTPSYAIAAILERHYAWLGARDLVLDAGCGTGRWLRVLREQHPDTPAVGVELDPQLVKICLAQGWTSYVVTSARNR